MTDPTKSEVDRVLDSIERTKIDLAEHQPDCRRLPPLQSMEFTRQEKQRLRTYCAQMTRYRILCWWKRWLGR